jgi:hypothetical protein
MRREPVLALLLAAGAARAQTAPASQPWSPDAIKALQDVEQIGAKYAAANDAHLARLRDILKHEYADKIRVLDQRYGKVLAEAEAEFKTRMLTTEELLKQFLAKYPNDPRWTPDAMFRLADVYLDEAKLSFDEKQAALESRPAPAAPPEEENPDAPPQYVGPDFTPSIAIWKDIVRRFPDYRQVDGTVYLLGYYQGEMRMTGEAKQAYLGLVCHNKFDPLAAPPAAPDPRDLRARARAPVSAEIYNGCVPMKDNPDLVDEAWVRIGEVHFDTRGELPLAIAAYKHVATTARSKFYDIALYKLAWSYYRNNQYLDGIQSFDELVSYSDKAEDSGGQQSDLRGESVQYLAISFAEPWEANALSDPVKSLQRINAFYKGRTGERHVRDVYEQLGDILRLSAGTPSGGEVPPEISTAYRAAVQAWRFAIDNWPLHPRDPLVQQKIIDALAFIGDAAAASDERAKLAANYKRGSAWYTANETNREAMEIASRLGEGSLLDAARNIHRNAQIAKATYQKQPTPENKAAYVRLYAQAADLYSSYLAEFPSSSQVYELTYRLADCLYFSEQYRRAVQPYRWVRDHAEAGTSHHDEAADSIVKSYESAVDQAKAQGAILEPAAPTAANLSQAMAPISMPDLYRELQAAYDEYGKLMKDSTVPAKSLAAAMISFRFHRLDDALARFSAILEKNCHSAEATQAKEGMLAIYQARGQNDKFEATADAFIKQQCGTGAADVELAQSQKLSNDYAIAVKNFKDGNYDKGGQQFYALYRTTPTTNKDRAGALFNSALAFEKAGKPKTAIALYQEFTKVKEFQQSEYYVEALFRTAVSYQNAFDYETAVDTFLQVVDEAGKPGRITRPEFNLQEARLNAMYNAAFLRDLDRVYYDRGKNDPGAATLYKRYAAADTRDRPKASQAYFNAALVYEKAGNVKDMVKTFDEWRKTYGRDPGNGFYLVLSEYKVAKALEKNRDKKGAEDGYIKTIKAFDESFEKPGTPAAELAAESQFWLAEKYYKATFEPYKVKWLGSIASRDQKKNQKVVLETIQALQKVAKDTSAGYQAVARFQASWSLAAIVRLGDISFFAGQKLIEAPVPKEITRLDQQYPDQGVLANYQAQLESLVQPNTDAAKDQWTKSLQTAKSAGVANDWSKLAAQRLNAYIAADQYPVQRDELIEKEQNP